MNSFVHVMFHWPDGGIYSNILASVIVGVVLYFWKLRGWIKAMELHHQKIHELHERVMNLADDRLLPQQGSAARPPASLD